MQNGRGHGADIGYQVSAIEVFDTESMKVNVQISEDFQPASGWPAELSAVLA